MKRYGVARTFRDVRVGQPLRTRVIRALNSIGLPWNLSLGDGGMPSVGTPGLFLLISWFSNVGLSGPHAASPPPLLCTAHCWGGHPNE